MLITYIWTALNHLIITLYRYLNYEYEVFIAVYMKRRIDTLDITRSNADSFPVWNLDDLLEKKKKKSTDAVFILQKSFL